MMNVKRLYLDTNVYCRPLDDHNASRIVLEAEAFLEIITAVETGKIMIVSSDYVKFEIEQIFDLQKRKDVRGFEKILNKISVKSSKKVSELAHAFLSICRH